MNETDANTAIVEIELEISAWGTALSQLAAASGLSESALIEAGRKGAVWRKGGKAKKLRRIREWADKVSIGDTLFLNYNADVLAQIPLVPLLVSDEVNYSVWNKPFGMLSQGSKWSDHCTITETAAKQLGKPTFLVHRLDRAASGLIVVAHTRNALQKLTELFAKRRVEKQYHVQVLGQISGDVPLRLDADVQGKSAVTDVLHSFYDKETNTSLLTVRIETGRKHQIREHLFEAGYPVLGDRLFDPEREHEHDLRLAASRLAFECPFTARQQCFDIASELEWVTKFASPDSR